MGQVSGWCGTWEMQLPGARGCVTKNKASRQCVWGVCTWVVGYAQNWGSIWREMEQWIISWVAIVSSFPGGASCKESACQCRRCKRPWFYPWVRKIPWVGNGNPLQYSPLENSMDRGIWWATVYGVAKSQTWLSDWAQQCPLQSDVSGVNRASCLVHVFLPLASLYYPFVWLTSHYQCYLFCRLLSFIYLTYWVPGTVLGSGDIRVSKVPAFMQLIF